MEKVNMIFKADTAKQMADHFFSDEAQLEKVGKLIKDRANEGGYFRQIWIKSEIVIAELKSKGYKIEQIKSQPDSYLVSWGKLANDIDSLSHEDLS